jgi:hypothetical protein
MVTISTRSPPTAATKLACGTIDTATLIFPAPDDTVSGAGLPHPAIGSKTNASTINASKRFILCKDFFTANRSFSNCKKLHLLLLRCRPVLSIIN